MITSHSGRMEQEGEGATQTDQTRLLVRGRPSAPPKTSSSDCACRQVMIAGAITGPELSSIEW